MTPRALVLADDLTGAGDAGLQLRQAGLATVLRLGGDAEVGAGGDAGAVVVDTNSRNGDAEAARAAQASAVAAVLQGGGRCSSPAGDDSEVVVYKKVDSTLRGNVGAEVVAVMRALGVSRCVFAPAFPGARRTTVGGFQLVNGTPVHRTEMGKDPAAPVATSQLERLFDGEVGVNCVSVPLGIVEVGQEAIIAAMRAATTAAAADQLTVFICDATCDADLTFIAAAAAGIDGPQPLLAGSAGLAAALVPAFGLAPSLPSTTPSAAPAAAASSGRVHVISGSSTAQNGVQVDALTSRFTSTDDVVLHRTTVGDVDRLAAAAVSEISSSSATLPPSGLVLAGGATARAVLSSLGVTELRVLGEVESAVPLLSVVGGAYDGMPVITKAGALGSDQALVNSVLAAQRLDVSRRARLPLIGITMGDACGIGPEIIAKSFVRAECHAVARYVVIGSPQRMQFGIDAAGLTDRLKIRVVPSPADALCELDTIDIVSPFKINHDAIVTGVVCAEAGRCAAEWVIAATKYAVRNEIDAIATAPLNKEAMHKGGYKFGGHTELLRDYSGAKTSRLCLADPRGLTVVHATCHIPFKDIHVRIADEGKILETVRLARRFCMDMGYLRAASRGRNAAPGQEQEPKIAVAGLNPHCEPIFGDEETRIIKPAVDASLSKGWNVHGPIPADTVYLRALKGEFDVVVAMYHDQGHIPAKVGGFGDTVNCTLGLPIIRTSVDHGTAFDIAGKGIAHEQNLVTACAMAAQMARTRKQGGEKKEEQKTSV